MAYGVVVGGSLNRRSFPLDDAQPLGQYTDGAYISIENYNADWYKTTFVYNGTNTTGYVKKAFVAVVGDTVKVRKADVIVRQGAGQNYSELYRVGTNASGNVTEITKNTTDGYGWIKANYGSGVGWIRGDMFNKSASGGGGDQSLGYNCITVPGGAMACSGMNTANDRYNHDGRVVVVDEGYNDWMFWPGQVEPRYFLRKNIDVSYDNTKSANTVFGSANLSSGSSGRYVMHLQHYLNRWLYANGKSKIAVDGVFGTGTDSTVRNFQTDQGLTRDGVVGSGTKSALISFVNGLG